MPKLIVQEDRTAPMVIELLERLWALDPSPQIRDELNRFQFKVLPKLGAIDAFLDRQASKTMFEKKGLQGQRGVNFTIQLGYSEDETGQSSSTKTVHLANYKDAADLIRKTTINLGVRFSHSKTGYVRGLISGVPYRLDKFPAGRDVTFATADEIKTLKLALANGEIVSDHQARSIPGFHNRLAQVRRGLPEEA